jgi:hypothetical protein
MSQEKKFNANEFLHNTGAFLRKNLHETDTIAVNAITDGIEILIGNSIDLQNKVEILDAKLKESLKTPKEESES